MLARRADSPRHIDSNARHCPTTFPPLPFAPFPRMTKEFQQHYWDAATAEDCREIVRLAVREDLGSQYDWTTVALVPSQAQGRARVVARQEGVVAGLPAVSVALEAMEVALAWQCLVEDGASVGPGQTLAELAGPARQMLTAERIVLNLLGRLSGVATLTQRFVRELTGTQARLYDTRKTTPGWRRLEKYAVHCGGGHNHRAGLFDAILIKDNHLAFGAENAPAGEYSPAQAVVRAREFVRGMLPPQQAEAMIVEVEVDSLAQLAQVLPSGPDLVLLDNMPPETLRRAVALRDQLAPGVELEASGGISLSTIRAVAETGVDRISCGALTHSAVNFDVGLDWGGGPA